MNIINFILILSTLVISTLLISRNILHFFQLDSYQFPSFYRTIVRNKKYSLLNILLLSLTNIFLFVILKKINSNLSSIIYIILLLVVACLLRNIFRIKKAKKPLVLTSRFKRLYIFYVLILSVFAIVFIKNNIYFLYHIFIVGFFSLSALLAWPLEKLISELYFRDARNKLKRMPQLIKIGITGSYGKTTVKNILGSILSDSFTTLISPMSFNTPMGLTRTIREHINPNHRIFIAEMGTRHIGDINELCRLINPKIGILTAVGPQHLDTFKSIDRIIKGKYELIEKLPKDGHAFFQDDQGICKELYNKTNLSKTLVSIYDSNADVYAYNIKTTSEGSTFNLKIKSKGDIECKTALLGEHNIKNILISAAVCSYLGLNLNRISMAIYKLKPIKNRLEIIKTDKYTIINDAFNSNPVGSKAALDVLATFNNRKIIITPGMVELGKDEQRLNKEFGAHMANCTDIAILIGKKHVEPIKEGLLENGFNIENLYIVQSLDESTELLNNIVQKNDVVLYENDLPDNYIEA